MPDYYSILELDDFASAEEIKAAHRRLSKRYHPDLNNGNKYFEEKFKEIQHAYEVLRDPVSREAYDNFMSPPPPPVAAVHNNRFPTWLITGTIVLIGKLLLSVPWDTFNEREPYSPILNYVAPVTTSVQVGTTKAAIHALLGEPSTIVKYKGEETWSYGNSTIIFKNDIVVSFNNLDGALRDKKSPQTSGDF